MIEYENQARSMAIYMRYEQLVGKTGGGLRQVGKEFGIGPESVRFHVIRERLRATAGMRKEMQADKAIRDKKWMRQP